jgi:hypothetical protein
MTYTAVLGHAFRRVYRAVRPLLTRTERRLFQLLYFPQPFLNGRIALLEPVISSFVFGTDGDTLGVAFLALAAMVPRMDRGTGLRDDLRRRWQAFLRVYPAWLDIVRDDERENRRTRLRREKLTSLETVVYWPRDGRPAELKDLQADPKVWPPSGGRDLAAVSERLPELVAKYCSPGQARYVIGYFRDWQTESDIAAAARVSQQAVSKGIKSGVARLKQGLICDGFISADGTA